MKNSGVKHLRVNGEYGFLTREGIRQILVDGGAVAIPKGIRYVGISLSASALAISELINDEEWREYQNQKSKIWKETVNRETDN